MRYGAPVLAIRRSEETVVDPGCDERLVDGDLCVIVASPGAIEAIASPFAEQAGIPPYVAGLRQPVVSKDQKQTTHHYREIAGVNHFQ
jgi:hypothetical protein